MPVFLKAAAASLLLIGGGIGSPAPVLAQTTVEIIVADLGGNRQESIVFPKIHPRLEYLRELIRDWNGDADYIHFEEADSGITGDSSIKALWSENKNALALLWGRVEGDRNIYYGTSVIDVGELGAKVDFLNGRGRFSSIRSVFGNRLNVTADMHLYILGYALLLEAWDGRRTDMICPILGTMRTLHSKLRATDSGSPYFRPILNEVREIRASALRSGRIKATDSCARPE